MPLTAPELQQAADTIQTFIRGRHEAAGSRPFTPSEAEAWYKLCVAHDAIEQADRLLSGQPLAHP